ncbi:MAG: hypothetical protein E6H65_16090 [Betaproteobacteria bacterium]|nr:MAG: hypothetical protein E6H65_16090 [Betaproteobacteria bacterium]
MAILKLPPNIERVVGAMKEYRLAAWPELAPPFHRTAFRRMLSDMSHRHMTLPQLSESSGLRRHEVKSFVEMLEARGVLVERESLVPDSLFWSLGPLGGWLKRAMSSPPNSR